MSVKLKLWSLKKQAATAKAKAAAAKKQTAKLKQLDRLKQPDRLNQAATAAALKGKEKKTRVAITKTKMLEIGELTEENLRRHNFKHYPRKRLSSALPSFSSEWAQSTISLKFMTTQ